LNFAVLNAWIAQQKSIVFIALIMSVIFMMIMPMPLIIMDVLIAFNMTIAIMIMLVITTIQGPLEFSTFPTVILVSTLLRLAISVSTTRLILIQGDAGDIVAAFGEFVISGNLVVGLVIFLIITVVQFLVITKGADRVAEVSARFTLDAMPGKQMSIDADVRAGNIDQQLAQSRRIALGKESQLFGAMDGAMKFVKGDAVAGLIITAINIIGGLLIGILQRGLGFSEALQLYALLTIGDGLISQIPALLISVSSGTMVTRVTSSQDNVDVGGDIIRQMFSSPRTLKIASIIVSIFGMIPGFPIIIFSLIAVGFYAMAMKMDRQLAQATEDPAMRNNWQYFFKKQHAEAIKHQSTTGGLPTLVLALPKKIKDTECIEFSSRFEALYKKITESKKVSLGHWQCVLNTDSNPEAFEVHMHGSLVRQGHYISDYYYVHMSRTELDLFDIEPVYEEGSGCWVSKESKEILDNNGVKAEDALDRLLTEISDIVEKYLGSFITVQDVNGVFSLIEKTKPILIEELKNSSSVVKVTDVLKRLLEEDVSISNLPRIFEAIMEWSPKETNPILLVEYVRLAIGNDIVQPYSQNNLLNVVLVAPSIERALREGLRATPTGSFLVLPPDAASMIVEQSLRFVRQPFHPKEDPVLVTQMDIRRHLRNLLAQRGVYIPVVSFQEIPTYVTVYPVGLISEAFHQNR